MKSVSETPTPYMVVCAEDGDVFMTEIEYVRQLRNPDAGWTCPRCGRVGEWSDTNYERQIFGEPGNELLSVDDDEPDPALWPSSMKLCAAHAVVFFFAAVPDGLCPLCHAPLTEVEVWGDQDGSMTADIAKDLLQ